MLVNKVLAKGDTSASASVHPPRKQKAPPSAAFSDVVGGESIPAETSELA